MVNGYVKLLLNELPFFIISTIILYICSGISQMDMTHFNIINGMFTNWEMSPIINIKSDNYSCPKDFELITQYNWPGTVKGCYCNSNLGMSYNNSSEGIKKLFKILRISECSETELIIGCKNVPASPSVNLSNWKNQKLCAERVSKYNNLNNTLPKNYYDLHNLYTHYLNTTSSNIIYNNTCHTIDNLYNKLCFGFQEKETQEYYKSKNNYTSDSALVSMSSSYNYNFYFNETFNTNSDSPIIIGLTISEGQPCIDPTERNLLHDYYPLIKNKSDYFCTHNIDNVFYDTRYILKDQDSVQNFYNNNDFNFSLFPLIEETFGKNSWIGIYAFTYIGWSVECSHRGLDPRKFYESFQIVKMLTMMHQEVKIYSFIFLGITCITLIVNFVKYLISENKQLTHAVKIIDIIKVLISFLGLILCFLVSYYSTPLLNLLGIFSKIPCSDNLMNKTIHRVINDLNKNFIFTEYCFWLFLVGVLIVPVQYLLAYTLTFRTESKIVRFQKKYSNYNINLHDPGVE
jgi:hypothetical protein